VAVVLRLVSGRGVGPHSFSRVDVAGSHHHEFSRTCRRVELKLDKCPDLAVYVELHGLEVILRYRVDWF
jgi:hypothetical protein